METTLEIWGILMALLGEAGLNLILLTPAVMLVVQSMVAAQGESLHNHNTLTLVSNAIRFPFRATLVTEVVLALVPAQGELQHRHNVVALAPNAIRFWTRVLTLILSLAQVDGGVMVRNTFSK
jgi:hypothetical protein